MNDDVRLLFPDADVEVGILGFVPGAQAVPLPGQDEYSVLAIAYHNVAVERDYLQQLQEVRDTDSLSNEPIWAYSAYSY